MDAPSAGVTACTSCARDAAPTEAELIAYCRAHLSAIKCPKSIDIADALPRHANGKLLKRELRDRYWPS